MNLIDVGANRNLPLPLRDISFDNIMAFDPKWSKEEITETEKKYPFGLWEEKTTIPLYRTLGGGFECFKANEEVIKECGMAFKLRNMKIIDTEYLQVDTLDNVLLNSTISYEILKVDTQGSEGKILKGAENYLKNDCQLIYIELFEKEWWSGIDIDVQILEYLKQFGFNFSKIIETGQYQNDWVIIKDGYEVPEELKKIFEL